MHVHVNLLFLSVRLYGYRDQTRAWESGAVMKLLDDDAICEK